jgi:hypothetical protein
MTRENTRKSFLLAISVEGNDDAIMWLKWRQRYT